MPLTITLHMVASLDGRIARDDDSVDWLDGPDDVYPDGVRLDADGIARVLASIDAYVLGSRTYERALELGWPYGDTPAIVATSRTLPAHGASIEFFDGDLPTMVNDVLAPRFEQVWVGGGAALGQSFLALDLVDRMVLTIAPVVLGGGVCLFGDSTAETRWMLRDSSTYTNGFVELTYERERRATTSR